MATSITKTFSVGDTVYVRYPYSATHSGVVSGFTPVARTVSRIDFVAASNECDVSFTDGATVRDGAIVRVYLTQALCAAAIVTDLISVSTAVVLLDTTTSSASTASQASVSLRRASA